MIVRPAKQAPVQELAPGVKMRWCISQADGAENFYLRLVEVAVDSAPPPPHEHPFEHEMYILEGRGTAVGPEGEQPFNAGDTLFIPPGESHQLRHLTALKFICLIPATEATSKLFPVRVGTDQ